VDDIIIAKDDEHEKLILKEKTCDSVRVEDFGKLNYFHGIKVAYLKRASSYSKEKMF